MGGLPWYCIASDFSGNPKVLELADRLDDHNAGMYALRLFEHCATKALDGKVRAGAVEGAAGWRGKRGVLREALLACRILDATEEEGVFLVHGWEERNGGRIRKAIADAAKPRGNKRGPSPVPSGTAAGPPVDDVGTAAGPPGDDGGNTRHRTETSSLRSEGAPPAAPPPEPGSAAGGGGPPDSPPPAAPPSAPKSEHAAFVLAVQHWFAAWERAGRGKHARLTGGEGKQLKALVAELGLDELCERMDRALSEPWFLANGDLLTFVKQGNKFARRGAVVAVSERAARLEAALRRAEGECPEWAAMLKAAARPLGDGGLPAETVDSVLVDIQAERRGKVLELRARDVFHANLLADRFHERLLAGARAVSGEALHVEIVGPKGPEARA
jgi:hypothetical protein